MNTEENDNHILIEVLNENGDLKLTKFRNPRAIWQNNDYPDEYTFRDVDIVNVFQLQQENKQLKKELEEYKRLGFEHLNDKCNKLENQQKEFIEYLNSYIELLKDKPDLVEEGQKDILEEILSKYYEIIEKLEKGE